MTECQSCSARSELSLCGDCFGHLTDALAELPWLLEQLAITETRQDRRNLGIIGAAAPTSVVNSGAAGWPRRSTTTQPLDGHAGAQCGLGSCRPCRPHGSIGPSRPEWKRLPRGYSGSSAQRIAWLFHHAGLIARHAGAADIYRGLITAHRDPDTPMGTPQQIQAFEKAANGFSVHIYASEDQARNAITNRDVYGRCSILDVRRRTSGRVLYATEARPADDALVEAVEVVLSKVYWGHAIAFIFFVVLNATAGPGTRKSAASPRRFRCSTTRRACT